MEKRRGEPVFWQVMLILLVLGLAALYDHYSRITTLATFNAGLIPLYPFGELETRAEILAEQIRLSNVDIWCLQEVWLADVQRNIYNSVKDVYPYALSAVDLQQPGSLGGDTPQACTVEMLEEVCSCAQSKCVDLPPDHKEQAACIIPRCLQVITALTESCLLCVLLTGDFDPIKSVCLSSNSASRYSKTYGLMILSRKELVHTKVQAYSNHSQFKGFLQATVQDVGDLVCVHTSSDMGDTYFGPPVVDPLLYNSYPEQQYAELTHLFDVLATLDEPVLVGDFNHGPTLPGNITWEFPLNYGLMTACGLSSPYVILDGRCTWCGGSGENEAAVSAFPYSEVIDHIYLPVGSLQRVESVERILDTVSTPSGVTLSDHYGVKMQLTNYYSSCTWWQHYLYHCKSRTTNHHYHTCTALPPLTKRVFCTAI